MRHLKTGNRLGMTTAHRRAVMRNMVTSILENGQITCTLARAKEVRKPLEKMISWGKRGDLHARRHALRFVKSKEAISALFGELADRYKDRQGGYSRIIKLGKTRLGDNSEMAIVQLLESDKDALSSLKSKLSKNKNLKKKDNSILQEVSEEVKAEEEKNRARKNDSIEKQETVGDKKNNSDEKIEPLEKTPPINDDSIEKQETISEQKNISDEKIEPLGKKPTINNDPKEKQETISEQKNISDEKIEPLGKKPPINDDSKEKQKTISDKKKVNEVENKVEKSEQEESGNNKITTEKNNSSEG